MFLSFVQTLSVYAAQPCFFATQSHIHAAESHLLAAQPHLHAAEVTLTDHRRVSLPKTHTDKELIQKVWCISVPKAPQGNNFTYLMNVKEMVMWEVGAKNAKHIKSLEEQMGMNLD